MAPIQMVMWGHPSTTGLKDIDYFITSDLFEDDYGGERFSEQLLRFSSSSFFFKEPKQVLTAVSEGGAYDRGLLGVGGQDTVFLVPQTLQKFHPVFDEPLRRILEHSAKNRLLIIYDRSKPLWKAKLAERFERVMGAEIAGRIAFTPSTKATDFFRLIATADVLLDPYPFGGGVTTLEVSVFVGG